jgi:peptidoglycan hydrolase-like protein with peptidoglycan-binding domain
MRTLNLGDSGEDVVVLQSILRSQGHFDGAVKGNFGPLTKKAVIYFQMTHLGPKGFPLAVDGQVGPDTWWALQNPSGKLQSHGLQVFVPSGLSAARSTLLKWAATEHGKHVVEEPDGSNWGGRVSHYLKTCGLGPAPWCGCYVSTGHKDALGAFPLNAPQPHVQTFMQRAKRAGIFHPKGTYSPIPGDIFIYAYRGGTGHTGFVAAVDSSVQAQYFNTNEGNCGNRVKFGLRSIEEEALVGFVNVWGDNERDFETRIVKTGAVAMIDTR